MSLRPAQILLFFVALVVVGGFYLGLMVAWGGAFGSEIPRYGIGKWILLAVAVGLFNVFAELVLYPRVMDPDKVTDPLWKRSLRLSVALGAVAAFCVLFWLVESL